jgi:hypothetical protein
MCALLGALLLAASAGAAVPNPTVEGPVEGGLKGYPWNHSLYDLRAPGYDYTEQEFFYGGTAHSIGFGLDAPYKSRFLVRLPRDPRKFSGTVLVEWLNVTGQNDLETAWPVEAQYLMRHGDGYVGVSAQEAGLCCGPTTLIGWDPKRYAGLIHPSDTFAADIFSQSIEALRDPEHNLTTSGLPRPADPMRGMRAKKIVVTGASQSAAQLTTFINEGYNRGTIDAYVITRGGGPFEDLSTPVFHLNEENQDADTADSDHYVLWQEAGTAHAPAAWWNYVWAELQRDQVGPGVPNAINLGCSVNRGSVDYSTRAMSYWTQRFLDDGVLPPGAPRLERDDSGGLVRDENGLAKGGLRHPFVQVPVALNRSDSLDCPLWGHYEPWAAEKIRSLYASHQAYVAKVRAWARFEVKQGWLLPGDRDDAVARAKCFKEPWTDPAGYDARPYDPSDCILALGTAPSPTALPLRLLGKRVAKRRRGRSIVFRVLATEPLAHLRIRLRRGRAVVGRGSRPAIYGRTRLRVKLARRTRPGRYRLEIAARDQSGRLRSGAFVVRRGR